MVASRYVPEFRLSLAGQPIPAAMRASITAVTCQTGFDGADRVELSLANEKLRWLDHPLFDPDTPLTLVLGYLPDLPAPMFAGEVVGQSANFPADGSPTLTVTAQDRRRRLQQGSNTRWFPIPLPNLGNRPLPDQAIATQVAGEHALAATFDPLGAAIASALGALDSVSSDQQAQQQLVRKQEGESDYAFLERIASENGWELLIDHANGGIGLTFFSAPAHLDPDVALEYGRSLVSFSPRVSTVGQVDSVMMSVWSSALKKSFTISVGWDWDKSALSVDVSTGSSAKGKKTTDRTVDEPVTLSSAPRRLIAELIPKLNERLTGSGSTVGDPRIRAGSVLRLDGLGKRFGGLYRVTSVTHSIDAGGYRTDFDVRKDVWFGSIPLESQGAVAIQRSA